MTVQLSELLAQSQALDNRISEARRSHRQQALDEVRRLMSEHGLTVADVASTAKPARPADARKKVAPKYRDPATGSTWTGRGLKPRWVPAALQDGKSLSDFAL